MLHLLHCRKRNKSRTRTKYPYPDVIRAYQREFSRAQIWPLNKAVRSVRTSITKNIASLRMERQRTTTGTKAIVRNTNPIRFSTKN